MDERFEILQKIFDELKKKYFPRIPAYEIVIAEIDKDFHGRDFYGRCNRKARVITVAPDAPADEYRRLMLHEMAHHGSMVRHAPGGHGKPMQDKLRRALNKATGDDHQLILDEIIECQLAHKDDRRLAHEHRKKERSERWKKEAAELAKYDPTIPGTAPQCLTFALDEWLVTGKVRIHGRTKSLAWLIERLENCNDIAPDDFYHGYLDFEHNQTYGQFVRKLKHAGIHRRRFG